MEFSVEWDHDKALLNESKHGVSFHEAATVLLDPLSVTLPDPDHSQREQRMVMFGRSGTGRHLVVILVEHDEAVRLISARPMTPRERKNYERCLEL